MGTRLNLSGRSLAELERLRSMVRTNHRDGEESLELIRTGMDLTKQNKAEVEASLMRVCDRGIPIKEMIETLIAKKSVITRDMELIMEKIKEISDEIAANMDSARRNDEEAERLRMELEKLQESMNRDDAHIAELAEMRTEFACILEGVEKEIAEKKRSMPQSSAEVIARQRDLLSMLKNSGGASFEMLEDPPDYQPTILTSHNVGAGRKPKLEFEHSSISATALKPQERQPSGKNQRSSTSPKSSLKISPIDDNADNDDDYEFSRSSCSVDDESHDDHSDEGEAVSIDASQTHKRQALDSAKIKNEIQSRAQELRRMFREQHERAEARGASTGIPCIRKHDGQWIVVDSIKKELNLVGYQGTRAQTQGFNVRFRNQVISSRMINLGVRNEAEKVDVVFEDPRDACEVYKQMHKLFK